MSIRATTERLSPIDLTALMMDYAPEEAAYLVAAGLNYYHSGMREWFQEEQETHLYKAGKKSKEVFALLKNFSLHYHIFETEYVAETAWHLDTMENRTHPDYRRVRKFQWKHDHINDFDHLLDRYRMAASKIAVIAPGLNVWFQSPNFMHHRFGYGYLRPRVELMPPFTMKLGMQPQIARDQVGDLSDEQINALQARVEKLQPLLANNAQRTYEEIIRGEGYTMFSSLLLYTPDKYGQTAWTMAQMLHEAGVEPHEQMISHATEDGMAAILPPARPIHVLPLTTLIMDYAPQEAAWLVAAGPHNYHIPRTEAWCADTLRKDQGYLYEAWFADTLGKDQGYLYEAAKASKEVQLFLECLRFQTDFIFQEFHSAAGGSPEEELQNANYPDYEKFKHHLIMRSDEPNFDGLLSEYRSVASMIHLAAPGLNAWFQSPNFMHHRWGYGYLRPHVAFLPPFSVTQDFSIKETRIDINTGWLKDPSPGQITALQKKLERLHPLWATSRIHRASEERLQMMAVENRTTLEVERQRWEDAYLRHEAIISPGGRLKRLFSSFLAFTYTQERYGQTAWTVARMMREAGVRPHKQMVANAGADRMTIEVLE